MRPRPVPLAIFATVLLLVLRLGVLWDDAGRAFAQPAAPTKPAAEPSAPPKPSGDAPATPPAGEAPGAAAPAVAPPTPSRPAPEKRFSPQEVELLQDLSKRRAELDQRNQDLDRRELLLKAAEQRVEEKISELKQLQGNVDTALGKVDEQEDDRLKSLVKTFEDMKPKEAAPIISELDLPVQLQIITRMKEQKSAPILAGMDTKKAAEITKAMAAHKSVPAPKEN